jgi:hypothetical protein
VKKGLDPLELAIRHVKNQCLSWDQQVERERQKKIREDQEARDAEARRLQEEQSTQMTLSEISDALEVGDTEKAERLVSEPIQVPRPFIQPEYISRAAPKIEGQSTTTTWKVDREAIVGDSTGAAYIESISKLLRAVKDNSYPIEQAAPLLSWDFSSADKLAGALMGAFSVPGLTAMPVGTMRVGRGKRKKG